MNKNHMLYALVALVLLVMALLTVRIVGSTNAVSALPPGIAQASATPITRYQTAFRIVNAPEQFDELLVYAQADPGMATPPHIHGGNQYVTVLDGELTRQVYRPVPSVKLHPVGDTWSEITGEVHQVFNRGAVTALTIGTFLLPRGVPVTTVEQTGETSQQLPGPKTLAQAKLPVDQPPEQFDLGHLVLDFQPGTSTPEESYGGQALSLVLAGTVTVRSNGEEKTYKAGESWSNEAGKVFNVANTAGVQASIAVSVLLPNGVPLTTLRTPAGAPALATTPMASITAAAVSNVWVILAIAATALLGGVAIWRMRARA